MSAEDPRTDRELLLEIHGDVKHLKNTKDDHEKRLRFLERASAVIALIGASIGISKAAH
jgi:hypothetical protein